MTASTASPAAVALALLGHTRITEMKDDEERNSVN
jgi:hypothetical protein